MKQQKRLRMITWLMLASEVLLLLFVSEWLRSQYRQQEEQLHQDIQVLFLKTSEKLSDSALDHMVAGLLRTDSGKTMPRINVQYTGSWDTTINMTDSVMQLNHVRHAGEIPGQSNTAIERITIRRHGDSLPLPEQVTKALRIAVIQTANTKDLYKQGFALTLDSNKLKDEFTKTLEQNAYHFTAKWDSASAVPGNFFYYRSPDLRLHTGITILGYQPYLLKQLLPQILFSAILLLLTGLAFWLAYRNMRRQKEFSEQKDSFISNVSHELKTPVATTKVALEALSNYKALEDPVRSARYLRMATWEMDRLETMINRVMNTIQAEQGRMSLQKESLDPGLLLHEITDTLQPLLAEKGIRVHWEQPEEQVSLYADRTHLQGTLYNLLDNAAKYGGDLITIGLHAETGNVIIKIADNGRGIPKEYHKKVFERFFRIPSGNEHNVKGHGLGLSYAQYIIEAHEGSLILESSSDKGACFIITLPATTR